MQRAAGWVAAAVFGLLLLIGSLGGEAGPARVHAQEPTPTPTSEVVTNDPGGPGGGGHN